MIKIISIFFLNLNFFWVLCFSFRFSISCIAFCKRGVISPCLQKTILFLSPWQYSHQVKYYLLVRVLLFLCFSSFGSPPSPPSLLPAIGEKILNQKEFFFLFWDVFFLSHKRKESKEYSHRKGRLKNSRYYFFHLFFISLLREED